MGLESMSFPQFLHKMRQDLNANINGLDAAESTALKALIDFVETVHQQFEFGKIQDLGGTPEAPLSTSECAELLQIAMGFAKHARGGALPHFEVELSGASRLPTLAFQAVGPLTGSDARVVFLSPTPQASEVARKYWSDHPTQVGKCEFLTWEAAASTSLDGAFIIGDADLDAAAPAARALMSDAMSRLKANDKVALVLLGRSAGAQARATAPVPAKGCLSSVLVLLTAGVLALGVAIVF